MQFGKASGGCVLGLGLAVFLNSTGVNQTLYHEFQTRRLAKQGTAHIYFRDADGIQAVLFTHENYSNKITRIPSFPCQKPEGYGSSFELEIYNLMEGHYTFNARIWDGKGNIEDKIFEIDIQNPDGGVDDILYPSKPYEPFSFI